MPSRRPYGIDRGRTPLQAVPTATPGSSTMIGLKPQRQFHLIQRLISLRVPSGFGFDRYFEFAKMGNPAYNDEAVLHSLGTIRAPGDVEKIEVVLEKYEIRRPVYFVGSRSSLQGKVSDFQAWFAQADLRTEQPCYFDEIFGRRPTTHKAAATNAWWSLTDHLAWTLDENVADLLLKAIVPD